MFYVKMIVLAGLFALTCIQLLAFGFGLLAPKLNPDKFVPSSLLKAKVTEVVIPTENSDRVPDGGGFIWIEYKDLNGFPVHEKLARLNSGGPSTSPYFTAKVGDEIQIEVKDPKSGSMSTDEGRFWKMLSKNTIFFAAILLLGAIVFWLL